MKPITYLAFSALILVAGCTTVDGGNPRQQAVSHFVSGEGGNTQSLKTGPDDQLRLGYADASQDDDSPRGASSAFDMVVRFGNSSTQVYRYRDPQTGTLGYYDAKGEKLGQYLLRNPVPDGRKTSGFGMRRHPVLKTTRMHSGVDWAAPTGTPIYAAADGTVRFAGRASGDGQQIVIDHGYGYETSYSHQSKFAAGIKPGVSVKQGQLIGYVGRTGLATGPHLHYEMIVHGKKVDPMKVHFIIEGQLTGKDLARFQKTATAEQTGKKLAMGD